MAEPDKKDEEIAEILLDLDNILSDISGGDQGKAEAIAKAASTPTLPPAQPSAPPPAAKAPPAAPPPVVKMPAPAAKAPPPAAAPAPKPAPAAAPVAKAPPAQPPAAPAEGAPVIELAPREGMIAKPAPAPAPAPAPKPAQKPLASEAKPPMEITLDEQPQAPAASKPAADSPRGESVDKPQPPAPKPAAAATPPAPAPAPAPKAAEPPPPTPAPKAAEPAPEPEAAAPAPAAAEPQANAAMAGLKDTIPEKTPKEQIRRVAFLHAKGHLEARDKFATFLDTSALTISKKPIYLRKVHAEEAGPQCDAKGVAARAKAEGAVAVLAVLEGLPESKSRELNDACEAAGLSFRTVSAAEVQKRSVAVDIMVDLMLLAGEA